HCVRACDAITFASSGSPYARSYNVATFLASSMAVRPSTWGASTILDLPLPQVLKNSLAASSNLDDCESVGSFDRSESTVVRNRSVTPNRHHTFRMVTRRHITW